MDTKNFMTLFLRLWTIAFVVLRSSIIIVASPLRPMSDSIQNIDGSDIKLHDLKQKVIRRAPRASLPIPYSSCETIGKWTTIEDAVNVVGKPVKVLQKFSQDNTLIQQNFYERYCASDERTPAKSLVQTVSEFDRCKGVDESKFHGFCQTRQTYSYAKVENSEGATGWTRILIRGGCECVLFDKVHAEADILHSLRH